MSSARFPTLTIASVFVAAALWSCNKNNASEPEPAGPQAQEQTSSPMSTTGGGMTQELRAGCPMVVEGADVEVTDTEGGVALTFTTEVGDVGDLRARVQHMAEMYGMHRGRRGMMWHHMGHQGRGRAGPGMGMGHMAGRGPMPAATATVTEIDRGARLELRPTDASQLEALREHVRWHQQRMESGECWMLQGQPAPGGPEQGAEESQ
jgi:hypothetical protein